MLGALAMLVETLAFAAPSATIKVEPAFPDAPATIRLSALSSPEETVIAYRWSGLDGHPPCRDQVCDFRVSVASCRVVRLELTTLIGETVTTTAAVCAGDRGARPPLARWQVEGRSLDPVVEQGDEPVMLRQVWIDREQRPFGQVLVPLDGGCHAVDLLAADRQGRIATAGEVICTGSQAPDVRLSARQPCPAPGEQFELCGEASDPLGQRLTRTAGDAPIDLCAVVAARAGTLVRHVLEVSNESGLVSTASMFGCAEVRTGPATMMFLQLEQGYAGDSEGRLSIPILPYGGQGPFRASGRLGSTRFDEILDAGQPLEIRSLPTVNGFDRSFDLLVDLEDARGLKASASSKVQVQSRPSSQDPPAVSLGNGCGGTAVQSGDRASPLLALLLLGAALRLRRPR